MLKKRDRWHCDKLLNCFIVELLFCVVQPFGNVTIFSIGMSRRHRLSSKHVQQHASSVSQTWRVTVLFFVALCMCCGIVFRLYNVQVAGHESYTATADAQYSASHNVQARRGEIYMHDDSEEGLYPVAVNKSYPMVYVSPKEIKDAPQVVSLLSSVLGMDRGEIEKKISDTSDPFEVIERKVPDDKVDTILRENLAGVHTLKEQYRYYPGETLASQTIGFVGSDGKDYVGRYGIEASMDSVLGGKAGEVNQKRDAAGRWMSIADRDFSRATDGSDIVLTMEYPVQYEVERILKETVEKHGADGGSIIVMEPDTGRILAMAGYPQFDPNDYSQVEDLSIFLNENTQLAYECGSVFKSITMAMGLDQGDVEPDSTYTDTGEVRVGKYTIMNSDEKAYGLQTMTQVLERSLNTGSIHVEKLVGHKSFAEYVKRFGFGEVTGSGFVGEEAGNIRNLEYLNRDVNFYTASFGQGISVTPLQLATAYSVLANGGRLMKPMFVDRIVHPDGSVENIDPTEVRRVIQTSTSQKISEMLRSVVVNGHGKPAAVAGYLVGGKTGTAQVAKKDEKGYSDDKTIGTFVGYAPIGDPKFTVVVKIDDPKDVIWAESVAAPAFGKVMEFLLSWAEIEPTEEYTIQQ